MLKPTWKRLYMVLFSTATTVKAAGIIPGIPRFRSRKWKPQMLPNQHSGLQVHWNQGFIESAALPSPGPLLPPESCVLNWGMNGGSRSSSLPSGRQIRGRCWLCDYRLASYIPSCPYLPMSTLSICLEKWKDKKSYHFWDKNTEFTILCMSYS